MNKNIIVVGAMAVGLYLLSQVNKTKKIIVKKKASRKYPKPHSYLKPKVKRVIARKKPIYHKPKPKIAAWKKSVYHKPKPKIAAWKKKIIKRIARRKR